MTDLPMTGLQAEPRTIDAELGALLMMDLLFATQQYDTVAHEKDTAWNVGHPDMSVRTYRSSWVYGEIALYPRLFWPEFEPALDALLLQK